MEPLQQFTVKYSELKRKTVIRKGKLEWNSTLDVFQNLLSWNIDFLKSFPNLVFPESDKLIECVSVFRRPDKEDFVQCSWVIHSSDGISSDVNFIVENRCRQNAWGGSSEACYICLNIIFRRGNGVRVPFLHAGTET